MSIFLQNYVQLAQGARLKPLAPVVIGGLKLAEQYGFAYIQVFIMTVTVGLMALFAYRKKHCARDRF